MSTLFYIGYRYGHINNSFNSPKNGYCEHEQVFSAWIQNGGQVKRLDKFWIKDEELAKQRISIYGNQAFAFVVAQIYNVELLSPDDTFVTRLEGKWTKRTIQLRQIGQLSAKDFPTFIKPVVPKIFIAGIFQSIEDFRKVTEGLSDTEEILISAIIPDIQAEARCYIMNGRNGPGLL